MADVINDQDLYRGVKELLSGKAKGLLDSGQLTLRVMRKLLEEKFGIAEGTLDSKKKSISAILKQALEIEPENAAEAAATSAEAPSVNPGALQGGGDTHKENRKSKSANGSEEVAKKAVKDKKSKLSEAEKSANRTGGSKAGGKDVAKARQAGKRPARDDDSLDGASDGNSGSEEDDTGNRQKKRTKKTHPRSPGLDERGGAAAGGAKGGKSVNSRSIDMMKEVCKRATIKIAPTLYTRNKTVPELEAALSELLARHGLNTHSRDKEIGIVRRQLERARDLEGIDTSNIISLGGGRPRRAAAAAVSFRDIFKQTKVDSDDEDEEEQEEGEKEQQVGKRKRRVGKREVTGRDEEEDAQEEDEEGSGESEGSEEEKEEAGPRAKRGKTEGGKPKANVKRQQRKAGDSDDKESEDLVDVVHMPTKSRSNADSHGIKAVSKAVKSRDASDKEPVQEDSEEAEEVKPAAAKKPANTGGRTKARRTIMDDDDEEEHEEASSMEEEEVEDDDSDFTSDDGE